MPHGLRARLRRPAFLLGLVAFLAAVLVQSGQTGSIDTRYRLQTTHSFWTSAPAVLPEDYPDFGLVGRKGRIYAWYGMGQSLLMLPADVLGTFLERQPLFAGFAEHFPGVREIVVCYGTSVLVDTLAILACLRLLLLFQFTVNQALAGALALLFGTTFLHYTQNMMENNFLLLLTLTGFGYQYEWLRVGRRRALVYGSLVLGANLLTRLTAALDLLAAALFLLLVLWLENLRGQELLRRLRSYARTALPCYAIFLAMDRLYQWYRFGSFFNTYMAVFAEQQKKLDPSLPANFPWETPLRVGGLGPLITPEKSIFLFDPLLVLALLLSVLIWKRFRTEVRAYLIAGLCLLAAYILLYARYTVWSGDFAWGDRYVTTPVQLLAMISVPLLLRHRAQLRPSLRRLGMAIVTASVVIQLASVVFWHPLEIYQMETLGHPTFVVGLRFKNIVAVALGKQEQWGLSNRMTREDDQLHSTTPNFFPFLLWRDRSVSPTLAKALVAGWLVVLAMLLWLLLLIRKKVRRGEFIPAGDAATMAAAAP